MFSEVKLNELSHESIATIDNTEQEGQLESRIECQWILRGFIAAAVLICLSYMHAAAEFTPCDYVFRLYSEIHF